MVTNASKLVATAVMWTTIAFAVLAQTPPAPDPTVPKKYLPVPKAGENMVLNPTTAQCKAGWRPGLRWSKEEFNAFCRQFEVSK